MDNLENIVILKLLVTRIDVCRIVKGEEVAINQRR